MPTSIKPNNSYILKLKCPDKLGVLARISGELYAHGAFINNVKHYADPDQQIFNMRIEFDDRTLTVSEPQFKQVLANLAAELDMDYQLRCASYRPKILIAVSKDEHCLNVLLTKWRAGVIKADIVGVISNHETCRDIVEFNKIPFHYLPISKTTKPQQEAQIVEIMQQNNVDLLVLARYMQILSDDLCRQIAGRAINIHHSFLPGFKGAKPYQQAHDRGVKIIGATAHYVTADLDEGPIIVQDVKPVDHATSVKDMIEIGHDTEATTLARAVRWHVEDRILVNDQRTIIL
ncbi:formyltetrahydrofolate deformylase [Thalassotalea sp. ND16A]|uniref:formyltetrahydrofolate deformylase n=1 Tax=Thalassotalea sp. ND16A TaxID=1535422 RepID=UPI00051A7303|nr:formyltetrahydrofolate deformylase [Thalassotalea sp. ND16A]KGJ99620.1 Formyltetrahydrofolate deformylase [Thalassotalea sp. ND16A]